MYLFFRSTNRKLRFSTFLAIAILTAATLPAPPVEAGIPGTPTTTTLLLSSASVASGTVVTLTASVSNGSALTLGTVTFCDATAAFCLNSAVIGTAQLTPAGTAIMRFIPAIGSHSYKAIFSASNGNLTSTSVAQPLTVTGLYATSTSILATGSAGAYTLTGTVAGLGSTSLSPAGGSVSFIDTTNGNTVIGSGTLGAATLAKAFAPRVNYATGSSPELSAAGDFNGDGKMDLAVTNISDNTVSVFLGNGDGTFQAGVPYAAGLLPFDVAAGDFNGDGKLDLVVSDLGGDTVSILLGNGDGTFQGPVTYPVGSAPLIVAVGDFNHDGKLDLAVVNNGGNSVSVLLGNGDGTFQTQATYSTGTAASALALGDFNGDGSLDLAVVDQSGNTMSVLLGNGDGTFQSPVPYVVGNGPAAVVAADFNGDGKIDLAAINSVDNTVSILLGVGDGTFGAQVTYATGSGPFFGAAADVNGDGNVDLVVLNSQAATLSVLLGKGDGTFQTQVAEVTGGDPTGLSIVDLNRDGFPDLVVANNGDNTFSVLLNRITQTASVVVSGVSVSGSGSAHLVDASYAGNDNFAASVSATTSLLSTPITTSLVLTANVGSSTYGQSVILTATLNPSASGSLTTTGETVTFKFSAATIGTGTLNSLGVATLTLSTLPAGDDSLTAVYPGDANFLANTSAPLIFTVNRAILTVTAQNASRAYGTANPAFTALLTGFVNGDTQLTATTGAPSLTTTALLTSPVATYPITPAIGTLTATNYSFVFVNGTLTVTQAVLTVTANNASRKFGAANPAFSAAFSGFVNGDTQATATPGAPNLTTTATTASPVATYPINAAIGTLVSTNYSFTFVNGVLTITQASSVITWANPAAITFGTVLTATQLNATANTAGSFVYTPAIGAVPGAGTQILSVTFTPTDTTDFSSSTASVTLVVNKATPVITWPTPAPILFGTVLSATQLNATASVAGTFVYTPAAGTTPVGGSDVLSVTFTPTDAVDYTLATATVTLTVSDISIIGNGALTQTINAGQTASFQVIVAPFGTATFPNPVTFSTTGLPTGATFSSVPATVPAGSGATAVTFMIQTTFFASTWNKGPQPIAPTDQILLLSAAIFLLMLTVQAFRKRRKLTPQLVVVLLLAAPCLAAIAGISGCSSLGSNSSQSFPLVVTETSGTQRHSFNLTLIIQK